MRGCVVLRVEDGVKRALGMIVGLLAFVTRHA
jgi:hypothetical protein